MPSIYEMTAEALSSLELNSTERIADNVQSIVLVGPLSWEALYGATGQSIVYDATLPFGYP